MLKGLILIILVASAASAQNSDVLRPFVDSFANFNPMKTMLENQQKQATIATTQAAAEEAHARAERIRLEALRETQTAQQRAAAGNPSAGSENQAKALEAQLADARLQARIEHLKVQAMKAREKHPDFDETMSHLTLPTSHAIGEAILDSDLSAEIMYWLGKHPIDCKLIGDLEPLSAVREIGRIEGTIAPLAP